VNNLYNSRVPKKANNVNATAPIDIIVPSPRSRNTKSRRVAAISRGIRKPVPKSHMLYRYCLNIEPTKVSGWYWRIVHLSSKSFIATWQSNRWRTIVKSMNKVFSRIFKSKKHPTKKSGTPTAPQQLFGKQISHLINDKLALHRTMRPRPINNPTYDKINEPALCLPK
jgi:hypothetical protein